VHNSPSFSFRLSRSVCKKCRERESGDLFAVKIISAHGKLDEALREAELLRRVQRAFPTGTPTRRRLYKASRKKTGQPSP
jgi:hypothetical protein